MSGNSYDGEGHESEEQLRRRLLVLIGARAQVEGMVGSLQEAGHAGLSERVAESLQSFDDEVLALAESWWRSTL